MIIGILGVIMQQVFLRWNQGQDLRQALITIALSVIFADQMLAAFGGISKDIKTPSDWPQSINLPGDVRFGFFRGVVVLGAALLIGVGLWWLIKRTRFGKIVRAGVDDRDMVSALGINVQLVFAAAFFLGAMLAGLGGVLGGTMISLGPGEDTAFLLNSLIVVIIGGMGSLGGAAIGALALGLVDAYADVYLVFGDTDLTNYSILVTFALLVAVLAVRPLGCSGDRRERPHRAGGRARRGRRHALRLHRLLPVGDPDQGAVARRRGGQPDLPVGLRRHGLARAGRRVRHRGHDVRQPRRRRRGQRGRGPWPAAIVAVVVATGVGLGATPRAASASTS